METSKKQLTVSKTVTNATLGGLKESYTFGENVQFTVTPETGYDVTEVKVNDSVIKAVEGTYSYTVLPEDTQITITVTTQLITLTPELGEIDGATVNGLEESYNIGNTVMFTITTEEYVTVDSITVNGDPVTEQDGTYSYVIKESDRKLTIAVATTRHAVKNTGVDIEKSFSEAAVGGHGTLYNKSNFGGENLTNAVIESNFYAPEIKNISSADTRFGMRIYPVDETGGGFSVVDVLIGKYNDNWYLDVGFDLRNTIRTDYQLNESQIDDVANGSLTVLVIKNKSSYNVYIKNGEVFDKVFEYTDTNSLAAFKTIDLQLFKATTDAPGVFGMKGTKVYAHYEETLSDEELIQLLVGGQVAATEQQ